MNEIAQNDAAPREGEAGVKVTSLPINDRAAKLRNLPTVDCVELYVARGTIRFPSIAAWVDRIGPELFSTRPVKLIVAGLIRGAPTRLTGLTRDETLLAATFIAQLERCDIPDTLPWAENLVRVLAERRNVRLVADQLRWAADTLESGAPLKFVRSRLQHALDIADGTLPLDLYSSWAEVAA